VVDKLIDAAKEAEMRLLSKQQDTRKVPMSDNARRLFDGLRARVLQMDTTIIELAEQKSVSYHGPGFFLEVLPRKNSITLLLDLDFNEVDDPSNIANDASEYKFLVNAVYEGGVLVSILDADDIEKSLPLIRQAWERG
jgi:predicted transport protein